MKKEKQKELSIIIPYMNDEQYLETTIPVLLNGIKNKDAEVIIIDNGSFSPLQVSYPKVRVIRNQKNIGVGGAFNQGVELAQSNRLILMGCDVMTRRGWYNRVIKTLDEHPFTIFNCVSSGFSDASETEPFRPKRSKRYGAFILYKVRKQDLPGNSPLRNDPKFSKILQGKWNYRQPSQDEFIPIRCLMGAFYWMHKDDFQRIHGWNGHRMWGTLEPFLSIKARAHGMNLVVDTKLETAHHFGRSVLRPGRPDLMYYNMLFAAHSMFSEALAQELEYYLRYGDREEKIEKLNVNQARVMLKQNRGLLMRERDYNNRHFIGGLIKSIEQFEENFYFHPDPQINKR